jgi:hypothetical protein
MYPMATKKTLTNALSFLAALAVCGVSTSALAADGQVTQVEYLANSTNPVLMLQLGGNTTVNYLAQQTSPGCSIAALSVETIKLFHSMAQTSLLAGKNVTLYTTTCNSKLYVYDIVLKK